MTEGEKDSIVRAWLEINQDGTLAKHLARLSTETKRRFESYQRKSKFWERLAQKEAALKRKRTSRPWELH